MGNAPPKCSYCESDKSYEILRMSKDLKTNKQITSVFCNQKCEKAYFLLPSLRPKPFVYNIKCSNCQADFSESSMYFCSKKCEEAYHLRVKFIPINNVSTTNTQ